MEKLSLGLLKQARRKKNLSVDEAATFVGKDRSFIWRIENAITDIKVDTLTKLLDAYGVSVIDVFVSIPEKG